MGESLNSQRSRKWPSCTATANFAKCQNFGAVLIADREIRLHDTPTELLANYGIKGYRLDFFARHCTELGLEHPMVRIILWCATSSPGAIYHRKSMITSYKRYYQVFRSHNITPHDKHHTTCHFTVIFVSSSTCWSPASSESGLCFT